MSRLAVDTSVAVPLLLTSHSEHKSVHRWWAGRELALSGHAAAETYAVLTRLPGDARLLPVDAARLLQSRFSRTLVLGAQATAELPQVLAGLGVAGGAVYDALVGLAAVEHDAVLATRDGRARPTYDAVGVQTTIVA